MTTSTITPNPVNLARCPKCYSTWKMFRVKTKDFRCRKCGTTYKVDEAAPAPTVTQT